MAKIKADAQVVAGEAPVNPSRAVGFTLEGTYFLSDSESIFDATEFLKDLLDKARLQAGAKLLVRFPAQEVEID